MDQRYFVVSETEFERMMKQAAKVGAATALEKLGEEKERHNRDNGKHRLHNTNLLMKNYRVLKTHAENSVFDASKMDESATDILINMMSLKDDSMIIDSIQRSAERTAIMMAHVDAMLELYRVYCEKSSNNLDSRRYDVLYWLYIAEEPMTVEELASCYHISKESVYSDKNTAIRTLSMLLFGIDVLK